MIKLDNLLLPGANIVFFAFSFLADTLVTTQQTLPIPLTLSFYSLKASSPRLLCRSLWPGDPGLDTEKHFLH